MNRNKIIRTILLLVVVVCFGYLAYYMVVVNFSKKEQENLSGMSERRVNESVAFQSRPAAELLTREDRIISKYKSLYLKNNNLIGWIKIDDTNIDYPVVKSVNGNGNFYLDHNYDGKEDRNGTLFMDDKCDPLKPSDNLIVYGHNMKSGMMFGQLDNYKDESFYQKHPVVKFDTIYSEGTYDVAFAFMSKVYSEAEITFKYYQFIEPNSEDEFDSAINEMRKMSIYDTGVEVKYGDKLITLSTCDYDEANGRFVVVCRKR